MAKVTGPLMSLDARGAVGKALVFIGWKGIKSVRQWLKPANPQSANQGDVRLAIGGVGRAAGKVVAGEAFAQQLIDLDLIPDQQSKQSYLVQYIKDTYLAGTGATFTGAYGDMLASLVAHTVYTAFGSAATTLGITEFDLDYASIAPFNKALGVYLLAKAAVALGFTGSPYSIAVASWTGSQVDEFVVDMQGA